MAVLRIRVKDSNLDAMMDAILYDLRQPAYTASIPDPLYDPRATLLGEANPLYHPNEFIPNPLTKQDTVEQVLEEYVARKAWKNYNRAQAVAQADANFVDPVN
jgi:hypothetical protein